MSRKDCVAGTKWDSLIKRCMPLKIPPDIVPQHPTPIAPPPALIRRHTTTPSAQIVAVFNPGLWIFVILATLGSILALAVWIVIYRRHTRDPIVEAKPAEQPLQKTDAPGHRPERNGCAAEEVSSPCHHLNTGLHAAPMWEEAGGAHIERTKHNGRDWGGGSAVRQETVPFSATELGGTALVTTKTV